MKQKMALVGLLSIAGASSCQKSTSDLKTEVIGLPNGFKYPLGSGYVSKTGTILNTACITSTDAASSVDLIPYPESKLRGGFSESRKTVIDKLGVAVSASANLGSISGGGSASVDLSFAESDLKTASYLSYAYRAGNVFLRDPTLSLVGKGLLVNNRKDRISSECGDEVVYRVDLGARFHVGIEYSFASKEMKDEMKAELKIKGPLGVTLFKLNESHSGTLMDKTVGSMNLVVYQEGGDQTAFKALADGIPGGCTLKTDAKGNLIKAGFQLCSDYFQNRILPYIQKDLPKQLEKFSYDSEGQLNVLRYYTKRYDEFGFPELQTEISVDRDVKLYKMRKIDRFDQNLFKVAAFLRSINLGIGGNPEIVRPKDVNLDPEKILALRRDLDKLKSHGQLGLNRCRGLLKDFVMNVGVGSKTFSEYMQPCDDDYKSFKEKQLEILSNVFPETYKSYFREEV